MRDERKRNAELQDVDVGCDEKIGNIGNKQDAGIKWCVDCMRGKKNVKKELTNWLVALFWLVCG